MQIDRFGNRLPNELFYHRKENNLIQKENKDLVKASAANALFSSIRESVYKHESGMKFFFFFLTPETPAICLDKHSADCYIGLMVCVCYSHWRSITAQ